MEELPITEDIINNLKSPLPVCRVCLDVSMEYIEFEAVLCTVNNQEITYVEGFHELFPNEINHIQQNIPTNFCASCGKDLLNAYMFKKRTEHANYVLDKFLLSDESSKLVQGHCRIDDSESEEKISFLNSESEVSLEKENHKEKPENTGVCSSSNISDSTYKELVKLEEDFLHEEFEYEEVYDQDGQLNEFIKEEAILADNETVEDLYKDRYKCIDEQCKQNFPEKCKKKDSMENLEEFYNYKIESVHEPTDENSKSENDFQTKSDLITHNFDSDCNIMPGFKKCIYCRRIIRETNMAKHMEMHGKESVKQIFYKQTKDKTQYICQKCGKICLKPSTLRNHIQTQHFSERQKHQCEECGLFFSYPSLLREHLRKHDMNNQFKCSYCDRKFLRKPQLDIHIRYHFNDFPYKCDQCDKCYASKSNLTDHIKSKHTKTTYDCERCEQKFKSQTGLRKHKYTHDGYPYNCPLCSVGQTSRSGMKQHMMGVHKDSLTQEEFDLMFPIIIPKTGFRRPKHMYTKEINQ